jgi:hypothetical protein
MMKRTVPTSMRKKVVQLDKILKSIKPNWVSTDSIDLLNDIISYINMTHSYTENINIDLKKLLSSILDKEEQISKNNIVGNF